jgi:hypothetical protein
VFKEKYDIDIAKLIWTYKGTKQVLENKKKGKLNKTGYSPTQWTVPVAGTNKVNKTLFGFFFITDT